ncbi:hypothetical protein ALO75_103086 [Pseudomonas syringae pv. coryli]|uniref:Uncharacterized protein n=1 Tax=Pseudomonas syringae pv. coryli TaxID=317659 RepID=A0A0P9NQ17_9PSED|nr:hypothetical protein ALO75_103086 [Pseudomonas syringae pv. coryli]
MPRRSAADRTKGIDLAPWRTVLSVASGVSG